MRPLVERVRRKAGNKSAIKDYIIRRRNDSHHSNKFINLQGKVRTDKVKEFFGA